MHVRNGKIARLSREIREKLNLRLEQSEESEMEDENEEEPTPAESESVTVSQTDLEFLPASDLIQIAQNE